MSAPEAASPANGVTTIYDDVQHCTAVREPHGNTVAMDCPYTGKGEEFSPGQMAEAAIAGCMLLSMGAVALRRELDISGTNVDVKTSMTEAPPHRIDSIDVTVIMPRSFDANDRIRLERAADACPIKHSFPDDVPVTVTWRYPE